MSDDHKLRKQKAMCQVDRVQAILRRWDPIGLGELTPADEYDSYAPHIISLVAQGCSLAQLSRHLEELRIDAIGLKANPERDTEIASEIVATLRTDSV